MTASTRENHIHTPPPARGVAPTAPAIPISLLELELSLASFDGDDGSFRATVAAAAKAAGGELLFDLPASGLVDDCRRIGVLRMPAEGSRGRKTVLALLDGSGNGIRIQQPDAATAGLVRFTDAFVEVLQRL